ncbi:MAG: hypothetical protein ACE5IY_10760 [bacterium]
MNFGKLIIQSIKKNHPTELGEAATLNTRIQEFDFEFVVADVDKYSFVFHKIGITNRASKARLSDKELKQKAETLANKITYLPQALEVVELDAHSSKVQLRSRTDVQQESESDYFEVILSGDGHVVLERFLYDPRRQQKKRHAFHVTERILENLVNDLLTAIRH